MNTMKLAMAVALLCGFSGCVAQGDPRLQQAAETAKSVEALKAELDQVGSQVQTLQNDVWALQLTANPYQTAVFDPSSPGGYSRIDSGQGMFLVTVKNVAPYVDGFRITCNFGNPSSATFAGFKLTAKWGPRQDVSKKDFKFSQWRASLREKELSLTDSLLPGSWNPVTFVLAPARADEFGYLELSITTDNIRLRQ